jgi:DNA-binding transcriptional LysR family regulator
MAGGGKSGNGAIVRRAEACDQCNLGKHRLHAMQLARRAFAGEDGAMSRIDLDQLADLDALLREGSVARAAERLHLSAPAMSRRLARLRRSFGDPLFVLAGRQLVPTERALALQPRVAALLDEARAVLAPPRLDLARVERTFTIRANDGLVGAWAARLAARVTAAAPGVRLRFMPRADKDMAALRDGEVDLDIGVLDAPAPEIHSQPLLRVRFVVVLRAGHPQAARPRLSAARFAALDHVVTSRRGRSAGPVDVALRAAGLKRRVALIVPGFQAALEVALASDFAACVPEPFARWSTAAARLRVLPMPVPTPPVEVTLSWHPRLQGDLLHRWLREQVKAVTAEALGEPRPVPQPAAAPSRATR